MRPRVFLVFALFVVVGAAVGLISGVRSAGAAFPGVNGKVAFGSFRDGGNAEIYSVNPDGSGLVRLTNNSAEDYEPAWSADGSKIVFRSGRDGNLEIYSMSADGSNQTRLTNTPADESIGAGPAWSPDGARIVFDSTRDGDPEIYVMNADGSGQTRLTDSPGYDINPGWSPDGQKLSFTTFRDGSFEIYTMNPDGSAQTNLTRDPAFDSDANWSPDGSKLTFASDRDGDFDIYSINADGTNVENLTRNFAFDADPSWSPDGTRIAFTSQRNGANQVFVMNADGSDQRLLLDGDSAFADWQPTPEAEPDPLQALADAVTGLGPGTSLLAKVNQAQAAVAAGNVRGACSILAAFIHEAQAQAGRKITPATATSLVGDATKIRNALGC